MTELTHPYHLIKRMLDVNSIEHLPMRYYKVGAPKEQDREENPGQSEDNPHETVLHPIRYVRTFDQAMVTFKAYLRNRERDKGDFFNEADRDRKCIGWEYGVSGRFALPYDRKKRICEDVYLLGIDFTTKDQDEAWSIAKSLGKCPLLYITDRSYHAYYPQLVGKTEFDTFMATCEGVPGIDQDWVRIKTEQGMSVFRWSANTPKYHCTPTCIQDDFEVFKPDNEDLFVAAPDKDEIPF